MPGSAPPQTPRLSCCSLGKVKIDLNARTISRGRKQIELTPNEWALLAKLASQVNRTVSNSELAKVLTSAPLDARGAVRQLIKNLRGKLEPDSARPRYLTTTRGIGYRLQVPQPASTNSQCP